MIPTSFVLDRILDRRDVLATLHQLGERGVERGRLAAAGRTGDEDEPLGTADDLAKIVEERRPHAEGRQLEAQRRLVEHPQHQLLAVDRGKRRRAEVEPAGADGDSQPPVLRQPVLGDVHAGEDLEPCADRRRHGGGNVADVVEGAVDAEADAQVVGHPLQVNVARARARGTSQDAIDRPHGRLLRRLVVFFCVVLVGFAPALGLPPIGFHRLAPVRFERFNRYRLRAPVGDGLEHALRVKAIERGHDLVFERDERLDLTSRGETKIVERGQIRRGCDGDLQHRAELLQRYRHVLAGHFLGKRLDGRGTHREPVEARGGHAQLQAQRAEDGVRCGVSQIDQHLAEAPVGIAVVLDGERQLLARDQLPLEQDFAERRARALWRGRLHGASTLCVSGRREPELKCQYTTPKSSEGLDRTLLSRSVPNQDTR